MSRAGGLILRSQNTLWYSVLTIVLVVISVGSLFYELFYPGASEYGTRLARSADLAISYIFLLDFLAGLIASDGLRGRANYFKHHWLNLISSIPLTNGVTRTLRLLRIVRALRVIKALLKLEHAEKEMEKIAH